MILALYILNLALMTPYKYVLFSNPKFPKLSCLFPLKKKSTKFQSLSSLIFVTIPKDDARKKNTHKALIPLIFVQPIISPQKLIKTTLNQSKT